MAIQHLLFVMDAKEQGDCETVAECAGCTENTQLRGDQ